MDVTTGDRKFDQFSPRKVLIVINQTFKYVKSKWKVIIISGCAMGLFFAVLSLWKRPVYTAELSFALDEGAVKSSTNSLSPLSEELGFGPSYEAGGIFSSMTNIMELMQSHLLLENTLKSPVSLYGKQILFANFFLDSLRFREKWMKGTKYDSLDFLNTKADREEEIYRNGIFNNMYSVITGKMLKVDRLGKGTSLLQVTLTSENELFSKYFLEALVNEVSRYYVSMKTYRSQQHVDFIQKRADSVKDAYLSSLYGRAHFTDANVNPNLLVNIVPGERKQTDVLILRETYMNLTKNLESAKTSLMQETPLIQYLDMPRLPLKVVGTNPGIKFILFFIVGTVLAIIVLLVRRFYLFLLNREE